MTVRLYALCVGRVFTMCGRYELQEIQGLGERFRAKSVNVDLSARYNVAPGQVMPVVVHGDSAQELHNTLELMKWGLVPGWAKDPKIGNKMINSRAETVATKFKRNFAERRCLIPADGFFEWHVATRDPYFIKLKGEDMLGFAGIWASWKPPEGNILHTFSIITGPPNELVKPIHNRMPVIIDKADYQKWLSPST